MSEGAKKKKKRKMWGKPQKKNKKRPMKGGGGKQQDKMVSVLCPSKLDYFCQILAINFYKKKNPGRSQDA